MKTILMTMTALAALTVAAPAAAQPWDGQRSRTAQLQMQLDAGIRSGDISRREAIPLHSSLRQLLNLERQFSANGFTGRENAMLRQRSALLANQIRRAERTGFANERTTSRDDRDSERRAEWDDRHDRDGEGRDRRDRSDGRDGRDKDRWDNRDDRRDGRDNDRWGNRDERHGMTADARFDRPNRGDRFAGDARVGHAATLRMGALPEAFRDQFRDNDEVYYRHDAGRIYRINRRTSMILGLFDI